MISTKTGLADPSIVQESIFHFAYGLEHEPQKYKQYGDLLKVIVGRLRKGKGWREVNYKSAKELSLEKFLEQKHLSRERMKKLAEEAFNLAFDNWQDSLSKAQLDELTQKRGREDITPAKVKLQSHFRENIWPGIKHEYLVESESF